MAWVNPRTWGVNETLTAAKMNEISSSLDALGASWTSYVPTWLASGTAISLGNGSITGWTRTIGKTVDFRILLSMGSSTTYGTGIYNFTLPSTPNVNNWEPVGDCVAYDNSAAARYGLTALYSGGVNCSAVTGTATRIAQTVPFTFASTDQVSFRGQYEIA